MKYLMAIGNNGKEIMKSVNEVPQQSGCYNWVNIFKGTMADYQYVKEDLDKYDVVHINMVPSSFASIIDASRRLRDSSTKLVLNNDYLPEVWERWNQDPMLYHSIQKLGDCTFGTEPIQVSQMIEGTKVIPHPTNTKELKLFKRTESNTVAVVYNNYDKNLYHTSLMTQRLKEEFKFRSKLINYKKEHKLHSYCKNYYDKVVGPIPFKEWVMEIAMSKYGYMPHQFHGYCRAGVEFAAIGVPVVGSDRSYSLKICYPQTICNPMDYKKTRELFEKLKKDSFREDVSAMAKRNVEFFNYANSKKRFLKMLEEVRK